MKRLFVAIKIIANPSMLRFIRLLKDKLKNEPIKWVDPDNLHLTLNFIGEVEEDRIEKIKKALEEIGKKTQPFSFYLEGTGLLGRYNNPRVIYIKANNAEKILMIARQTEAGFMDLGIHEKPVQKTPHLTLGRIKYTRDRNLIHKLTTVYSEKQFQEVNVNQIVLYESILRPQGPRYITTHTVALNATALCP